MARRPDIRRAELDAAAQCAQIGFTKADLLPALTLLGSVGTVSSDVAKSSLSDVFTHASLILYGRPLIPMEHPELRTDHQ